MPHGEPSPLPSPPLCPAYQPCGQDTARWSRCCIGRLRDCLAMDALLEGLDPEQRAAVEAPRGPVCVLAGAGTGQTRTITHRIAYLCDRGPVAPAQVPAVTFTKRAGADVCTRLRSMGVHGAQAVTF